MATRHIYGFVGSPHTRTDGSIVPRGVVHSFTNPGTMPAGYLAIVTPGGLHEKYLSESGQPAETETLPAPPEGPPDVERLRQRRASKIGKNKVL